MFYAVIILVYWFMHPTSVCIRFLLLMRWKMESLNSEWKKRFAAQSQYVAGENSIVSRWPHRIIRHYHAKFMSSIVTTVKILCQVSSLPCKIYVMYPG